MNTDLLKEYAKVQAKIKELEGKRDTIKVDIITELESTNTAELPTDYGTFSMIPKKTWTYSAKVAELAEKLKLTQTKEQQKGIATCEIANYLKFVPKK
jgi:hypothetical protein